MKHEDFFVLYHAVFTEDGTVRACGRNACQKLIEACNIITSSREEDNLFGDIRTGFLKPEKIINLAKELN